MRQTLNFIILTFLTQTGAPAAQVAPATFELDAPAHEAALMKRLAEVSGLAAASDKSVFAHNDEYAIVYEIALSDGSLIAAFALGEPTVEADFEGVAVDDNRVYLVTSNGLIYESPIGEHRSRVRFNIFDTGASAECEIEGLANGAAPGEFLLLCKKPHRAKYKNRLVIFSWSVRERRLVEPWMSLDLRAILTPGERKDFAPSALVRRPEDGSVIVLSARNRLMLIVTQDGALIEKRLLDEDRHPQAEGLALTPSGDLVIADEGARRDPGRITVYSKKR
ncbi:MAG: hypothetical protein ACE5FO_05980 [Parvularculaceae bacterium]